MKDGTVQGLVKGALIFLCASFLITAGVLLFSMEARVRPDAEDWYIMVRTPEGNSTRIDLEQMAATGNRTVEMALVGTGEDGRPHTYRGLLVNDLAAMVGAGPFSSVIVKGADTYSKKVTAGQVQAYDVMLAFEKDSLMLRSRAKGGPGPVRLLLPQEAVGTYNAQHCVKWVSEVVFE